MSTILQTMDPALFGCAREHQTGKNATQTVLIGQLRISCCGRDGDQKCLLGRSPSLFRPSTNKRLLPSGGMDDSAEGRASTLTACGLVSIPGDELHTWLLRPPPPLAPAAPILHSSLHLPFLPFSPSLLTPTYSHSHLSPLLSSPPYCLLFIVHLRAPIVYVCLFFSPPQISLSFLGLLAIIDIPPPLILSDLGFSSPRSQL